MNMGKDVGRAIKIYRLANRFYRLRIPLLPKLLSILNRIIFSCDIPYNAKIGEGVILSHNGLGVVINPDAIIGNNVKILQHVSIAGRGNHGTPIIEDNVFIGANALIMWGVHIGKGAKIGACALVITDIPAGATAVGIPAKVVR